MDGNRRWAKKRGLPKLAGHQRGYLTAQKIVEHAIKKGIQVITLWAFSTENWKRSKTEVNFLFKLLKLAIKEQSSYLNKNNIKINFIGRLSELPKSLQQSINEITKLTKIIPRLLSTSP